MRVIPTEEYFSIVKESLATTGKAHVRVTGVSMQPTLRHLRDSVMIVPPDKVRFGDIVLFDRRNGHYALHRVIGKGKRGFTMAGDNQRHMERKLPYDQIVGVVSVMIKGEKHIAASEFSQKVYAWSVAVYLRFRIYVCKIKNVVVGAFRKLKGR